MAKHKYKRKMWTDSEVLFLRENALVKTTQHIASVLGRSEKSTCDKIGKMGIKKNKSIYLGATYGRLTVLSEEKIGRGGKYYKCLCSCGKFSIVLGVELNRGRTISCGCSKIRAQEYRRLPKGQASYNSLFGRLVRRATSLPVDAPKVAISKQEHKDLISKDCFYCGSPPRFFNYLLKHDKTLVPKNAKRVPIEALENSTIYANGVDRIDSNLGYIKSNCIPCCKTCNMMKLDHPQKEFLAHIEKIYNFQKDKK